MNFSHPKADVYVPGGALPPAAALAKVTHLCIGAHQDDIEIMAHAGICDCLDTPGKAFGGVVVTNGAGSSRTGPFAAYTDEQMQDIRRLEQRKAADLGSYAIQIQLAHPSAEVKRPGQPGVAADLLAIFAGCQPEVVYLHQPADKHDTHIGVLARCLEAIRALPVERRPRRVLGCEVWRDLDWMIDTDKVALDSGRRLELAADLLKVFDSQISGGKRYDLATIGRRAANATYHTSHASDKTEGITWAMDLTPLVTAPTLDLAGYTQGYIDRLRADVTGRIQRLGG
ncbi:MAG: PIG-L family deacetylase [Opitutus sp.]|jgi:LmbE family N-acetylglucosaminyl deacetylase|nr:PIG-L family deacetylase [Opitutus sp.]MCS6246610.1 PIG-L family deacetylase [Opitutus sp.]MCS6276082.1 PIG-L family deacetylase [Opitutus sp.]MCS6301176.1 PIG-L family deacetylase [Opitutus sp.]